MFYKVEAGLRQSDVMRRLGQINHCWEANFSVPSSWTILRRLELNQVFSEGEIQRTVSLYSRECTLTERRSLPSWVSHETQNILGQPTPTTSLNPPHWPGYTRTLTARLRLVFKLADDDRRGWKEAGKVGLMSFVAEPSPATTSHCLTLSIAWVASSQQPDSASHLLPAHHWLTLLNLQSNISDNFLLNCPTHSTQHKSGGLHTLR